MSIQAYAQRVLFTCLVTVIGNAPSAGHDHSLPNFKSARRIAFARAVGQREDPSQIADGRPTCQLTVDLVDGHDGRSLAGLVRITNLESGKTIHLSGEIHRDLNWFALSPRSTVTVPQTQLRIEAIHGLETELATRKIDLTESLRSTIKLELSRIYDPPARGLRSGNTHLHLMELTYAEAIRYLRLVPQVDGLDLVFLSHLRRIPDERHYVSNQIVENSFAGGELKRLSQHGVLFGNGEEHRHNFGRGDEGYGHVMFLELINLVRPVSIGPGIMRSGTDGIPLQAGIRQAQGQGATVIWCHNEWGFEDVPNWLAGLLDAQNIFDGDETPGYEDSFYKYLNLGMHIPFSTGTDWFIYDFSRVYVPIDGDLTRQKWLSALAKGKSYITNGAFLEFQIGEHQIGDTVSLNSPNKLTVTGRAVGRDDFHSVELVYNGDVVHTVNSHTVGGHFQAEFSFRLQIDQPGWVALRLASGAGKNVFDKNLFAHTSPIYVEIAGQRIFRHEVAQELLAEMENNVEELSSLGKFANEAERETVLKVHRDGIEALRRKVRRHQRTANSRN